MTGNELAIILQNANSTKTTIPPSIIVDGRWRAPYVFFYRDTTGTWHAGIVINKSRRIIYLYDLMALAPPIRDELLKIAHEWFWTTEGKIPINIFMGTDYMERFDVAKKGIPIKIIESSYGMCFSMANLQKRTKKTKINLEG
ncbi:MAG: hypothetical protein D6698_04725 [Gammaproteobacteria bacterium]|nr:MAG: hypothetical protein D6698_04725 [Gammaproteobacteria bacterium]